MKKAATRVRQIMASAPTTTPAMAPPERPLLLVLVVAAAAPEVVGDCNAGEFVAEVAADRAVVDPAVVADDELLVGLSLTPAWLRNTVLVENTLAGVVTSSWLAVKLDVPVVVSVEMPRAEYSALSIASSVQL